MLFIDVTLYGHATLNEGKVVKGDTNIVNQINGAMDQCSDLIGFTNKMKNMKTETDTT